MELILWIIIATDLLAAVALILSLSVVAKCGGKLRMVFLLLTGVIVLKIVKASYLIFSDGSVTGFAAGGIISSLPPTYPSVIEAILTFLITLMLFLTVITMRSLIKDLEGKNSLIKRRK